MLCSSTNLARFAIRTGTLSATLTTKNKLIKAVDLHYAPTPNGWKITLLLEESGIPYKVHSIDMNAGDQLKEDFLRLSPNGRMPALWDPNLGVDVFESGAIMMHLAENYDAAAPFFRDNQRSNAIKWLFWVNAGLGPMAGQLSHFQYYAPQVSPDADHTYAVQRYRLEYDRLISVLDKRVKSGSYLAGEDYGIADMAAWPWVRPWKRWMGGKSLCESGYPNAYRWYESIKQRSAATRALSVLREEAIAGQKQREQGGISADALKTMFKQGGKSQG